MKVCVCSFTIADWLTLIYEALRNEIRQSGYIQADETFIKYQDPKKEHCSNGYLWTYHSPGRGVLFEWFPSRASECLDSMLNNYEGLLQTDGYAGYTAWLNGSGHTNEKNTIFHAACWAHARRKFVETPGNSNCPQNRKTHRKALPHRNRASRAPRTRARRLSPKTHRPRTRTNQNHPRARTTPPAPAKQLRQSPRLYPRTLRRAHPLPHTQPSRNRQQPHRERHSAHRHREEKLSILRQSPIRIGQRRHRQPHRNLSQARHQSRRLFAGSTCCPARHETNRS